MINTNKLIDVLFTNGGFSINILSGLSPESGYMVSLRDNEEIIPCHEVNSDTIPGYLARHSLPNDAYLGGWIDADNVYLDISVNIPNIEDALNLARDNSQLAIYDLSNGESIYLAEVIAAENLAEVTIR